MQRRYINTLFTLTRSKDQMYIYAHRVQMVKALVGFTYSCYRNKNTVHLRVITFLVSAGPGPALVDAVIAQKYWVAGVNIPSVALRVSLRTLLATKVKLTDWPRSLGVQSMLYRVMIPFCWSRRGGSQKKSTISGTSLITENVKFCGGAPGAKGRNCA